MGKEAGTVRDIRQTLNVAELRATDQRALILGIIRQGEGHLDADEIYRRARQKLPHLNLSTVYRNLQKFKGLGLVEEHQFSESRHHYEVKPSVEHHHLVCLGCGRVIEFGFPLRRYLKRNVTEAKDFDIVNTEIRITGYCSECRRRRE
jgi:Fur family ferric uptake transcriptional regulator